MNINPVVPEVPDSLQNVSSSERSLRVLFADRDSQVCKTCSTALIRANYQVEVCEDGESAWRILLKQRFNLLIASADMPRLSGLALIRQLRLADIYIPVVLVARGVITDRVSHDPWHKIDAVLLRPFTTEQLLRIVNDVLATEHLSHPVAQSAVKA